MKRTQIGNFLVLAALLIAVIGGLCTSASAQRKERLIEAWRPTHYEVSIAFDRELSRLTSAETRIDILALRDNTNVVDLDFGTMPVSGVTVNGESTQYIRHDEKLDVRLNRPALKDQRLNITVTYSGTPKDGLILAKDRDGFPSAIGDNWADRVHHWIPCLDHPSAKASVRFKVVAPAEETVVANGTLESVNPTPNGMSRTWIFSESRLVSPYNMVVAVGRFANGELKANSPVPVTYYVPRSDSQFAVQGFDSAIPALNTFSDLIAPYPYKKLALIVGATRFGGMENANTIVFTPNYFNDFATAPRWGKRANVPKTVLEINAHEIAHQWFGDAVTESTWADLWLSEGFATYFAGVFLERYEGQAAFRTYMREKSKSYLAYEKTRRAPIHDTETEKLFDLLNPNNYEKGGWVLHMLRGMIGEKAFFGGLQDYYLSHIDSTATTEDLRASLEKASGRDLRSFFNRWIYKAGHPIYQISWKNVGRGQIEITLRQAQHDDAFLQPVTIEIKTKSGSRRLIVDPKDKSTTMRVTSPEPKEIVIDPDEQILKEVIR